MNTSPHSTSVKTVTGTFSKLCYRLNTALDKYKTYADSDPVKLRELLPASEVWRLFVDGRDQQQCWLPYENRESGYLTAMYNAFETIYDFSSSLNVDLIKQLHKTATSDVKGTNYDKEKQYQFGNPAYRIGEFRNHLPVDYHVDGCYFLTNHTQHWNATLDGIREFLQKNDRPNSWHAISIRIPDNCSSTFEDVLLSRPFIHSVRQHISAAGNISDIDLIMSQKKYFYPDIIYSLNTLDKRTIEDLGVALRLIGYTKTNDELAQVIFDMANIETTKTPNLAELFVSVQIENTRKQLSADVTYYISEYLSAMKSANAPINKLQLIIDLVHNLAQLHPFSDGNCRTFCMLLLNYLLLRNGFPFVILDDPNRFDLLSREELLHEVIKGMEQTFELLEQKELFSYKVTDKDFDTIYFRHLTALEQDRRKNIHLNREWEQQAATMAPASPTKVASTLFARMKNRLTLEHSAKKSGIGLLYRA